MATGENNQRIPADGTIDAGLLVLEMITPHGETWTQQDIADACGCSRGYIWLLEKQARAKMRLRLQELRERGDYPAPKTP
jgi:transcriptional regulator